MPLSRRQFIERALLLGMSTSAAGAALAACTGGNDKPRPGPKNLSGRLQVLTGFTGTATAAQLRVQQALTEAFVREHTDLGVDFIRVTSAGEAFDRLDRLIDSKKPPDLVLPIGGAGIARYVDQNLWLDVHDRLAAIDESLDGFPAVSRAAASASTYFGLSTDRVVGIPLGVHARALAFNQDLFSRGNTGRPEAGWTLGGAFLDAARRLTVERSGQFGVAHLSPAVSFFGFGGRYYDASTTQVQFDRPASVAGAQFAAELVRTHRVQSAKDGHAAWRAGKAAMIELCTCEVGGPLTTDLGFAWDVGPMPAGPSHRHVPVDVQLGAIVASSKQHDLAWELLRFLTLDADNAVKAPYEGFGAVPLKNAPGTIAPAWRESPASGSTDEVDWMPAFAAVHGLADTAFAAVVGGAAVDATMSKLQRDAQRAVDAWLKDNDLP